MGERKTQFTAAERLENAQYRLGLWNRIVLVNQPATDLRSLEYPDDLLWQQHPQLARAIRNILIMRTEVLRLEELDPNEIADIAL